MRVDVRPVTKRLEELELGFHGETIDFDWRPYEKRRPDAQADFDRLIVSIYHRGILAPLIIHKDHVLIGMRRAEIGRRLGIETVNCWEILEDVSVWGKDDLEKLDWIKGLAGEVPY